MAELYISKKKRAKGRSNSYDERPKRVATLEQKMRQHGWRLDCLDERASAGRLTEKNLVELQQLETSMLA